VKDRKSEERSLKSEEGGGKIGKSEAGRVNGKVLGRFCFLYHA
jgi:hypothetical protein